MTIDYKNWWPLNIAAGMDIRQRHPAVLSAKQKQVFWCIADGMRSRDIPRYIGTGVTTFKNHRDAIRQRIPSLTSTAHYGALAMQIAVEHGRGIICGQTAAKSTGLLPAANGGRDA